MGTATAPRILLCASEPAAAQDIRHGLERAGHAVSWHPLAAADPEDVSAYGLILLEGSRARGEALQFCRRMRTRLTDGFVPILFVTADPAPESRLAGFEGGADACLVRPFAPAELLGQVQALLRIKEGHHRLSERATEVHRVNKRLQAAYQQIDQELEIARRIQQSFLPAALPQLPWVRFAVAYHPCGRVGGDFYDVFRLDEHHVGFYIADAMGHGVPASLLTIYLKKGVRAKEIFDQQYRLVPPGEVLQRLNQDLIEQQLAENPFVTMVYALLNGPERTLHIARAGHPHPLYVPVDREPYFWKQLGGGLLGVFETEFPVRSHQLRPGDKVLFYTDGTDTAVFEGQPAGTASLLACAARHKALPIDEFLEQLSGDLLGQPTQQDDFTLLGLEMISA